MNSKNAEVDSGKFENGIYTTKNGYSGLGLVCPKGTRLYDVSLKPGIYHLPEDVGDNEHFEPITNKVAPGVMPYYSISNYGRVMNVYSEKVLKPNYRPSGYEYYCLASEKDGQISQRKYSTHRMVMKTFEPVENSDTLTVNHKNGKKSDNYYDKMMPDGTIQSNLEWMTIKENVIHAEQTGLRGGKYYKLGKANADEIRRLHTAGYSYEQIMNMGFDFVSLNTIRNVCINKIYKDDNYTPKSYYDSFKTNPANVHRLTDDDADRIRDLYNHGYTCAEISNKFYPNFSFSTISDIVRGITHNR